MSITSLFFTAIPLCTYFCTRFAFLFCFFPRSFSTADMGEFRFAAAVLLVFCRSVCRLFLADSRLLHVVLLQPKLGG